MKHIAKKSLGQNFLKSDSILKKIVDAGEIKKEDIILEIGPGKGALTEKLLGCGCKVLAVEKDTELYEFLKTKFAEEILSGQFNLIYGDILNFEILKNLKALKISSGPRISGSLSRPDHEDILDLSNSNYKIIANIPYNITGAILKKFLTAEHQPESMVLMVQHEVAQRIIANDNKESILSISVKAYGKPKMITKVDKRYFSPAPKVNSAVIKIAEINRKSFKDEKSESRFWEIVKNGFAHKRKKLSGNLKNIISTENAEFLKYKDKRAEDLTLKEWIDLSNMV